MKKATLISVVLVCCTLFLSNLSAQQIPNSSFESWSGGTPAFYEEWGFSPACVVSTAGYSGNGAKIQEVEDPSGQPYDYGMGIQAFPCTTIYSWLRIHYKCNQGPGDNIGLTLQFFDEFGIQLSSGYAHIDNGWNTNEWSVKDIHTNFSITSILPGTGHIWFDGSASDPYNSWLIVDELLLIEAVEITKPEEGDTWIAGETDTIKWDYGTPGLNITLQYSPDDGGIWEDIVELPADSGKYAWDIPEDFLSNNSAIRIVHSSGGELKTHDWVHLKVKPYIITKLNLANEYVVYDIDTDRWGFGNYPQDMWPVWWWLRFNYELAIDPFTESTYSQIQGGGIFKNVSMRVFPDWESFVNTFTIDACYWSTELGLYSPTALSWWNSIMHIWNGSCFGIAVSNALAFEKKAEFRNKYQNFPVFNDPILVTSNENVIPVMTELFTHQYGNPHSLYIESSRQFKTPNQTLNDLKSMLIEDNVNIRALNIYNQGLGSGAHCIIPYALERDSVDKQYYYIWVWDNSHSSNTDAVIVIDTTQNGNNGAWYTAYGWGTWGGDKGIILIDPASSYLSNPSMPKSQANQSPFILSDSVLQIHNTLDASIIITDNQGNTTGFIDSVVVNDIPGSYPLILINGGESPPYGYHLQTDYYSMVMNSFTEDTIDAFFFTGNKTFTYERYAATNAQTDRLFFDGGVSVANPDQETKPIKLLTIVNDTTNAEEKLFVIRSLDLAENDSVKVEFVDNHSLKLISYGTAKDYEIGLEYVSETQLQLFGNSSIQLSANSTHIFVPEWPNLYGNQLTILVDIGNNGTIDDTLHIENQITDVEDDHGSMLIPDEYRLEQNYPNPFNSSTVIKYSIPQEGLVTLKIYNAIGEELTTLVNELKHSGSYTATFDAINLTSGIYFYRLQAGGFIETKKMILLK